MMGKKNLRINLLELMNLESPDFPSREHMVLVINAPLSFEGSLISLTVSIAE
jgi:hypothetical protein